jgi:hypothetical protein
MKTRWRAVACAASLTLGTPASALAQPRFFRIDTVALASLSGPCPEVPTGIYVFNYPTPAHCSVRWRLDDHIKILTPTGWVDVPEVPQGFTMLSATVFGSFTGDNIMPFPGPFGPNGENYSYPAGMRVQDILGTLIGGDIDLSFDALFSHLYYGGLNRGNVLGTYEIHASSLRVRASLDRQTFLPAAGAALPSTAHVPLGGLLDLQAIDQNGGDVPSTFTLGTASVEPDVAPDALYKNATLIRFTTTDANAARYQSVHRGTVAVTITPKDSSVPGGTLTVRVEVPVALGTRGQGLDPDLDLIAHRYGAPPQFIKAHADKESTGRFNRLAYRYEPIGPYVGDLLAVSRGKDLRTVAPYKDYRFETIQDSLDPALPFGSLVTLEDLNVSSGLVVGCNANGSGGHALTLQDPLPTAWEIFRCNDAVMNWTVRARAAGPVRARSLRTDPFTAQTSLASSYGLLQMTYVTAIDQMKWPGDSFGLRNPSALFDTFDNHLRDAGSLSVGTQKVLKDLKNVVDVSRIDTYQKLLDAFVRAWGRYNPGEAGYGQSVAGRVPQYHPTGASPVLGGGQ